MEDQWANWYGVLNWYGVKLLYVSRVSGTPKRVDEHYIEGYLSYEESVVLVQAASFEAAYEKAEQLAKENEDDYRNIYGQTVQVRHQDSIDCFLIGDARDPDLQGLKEGVEVYSHIFESNLKEDQKALLDRRYPVQKEGPSYMLMSLDFCYLTSSGGLEVSLHPTSTHDLPTLFQFQLEPEGRRLAAFMPDNATDEQAYIEKHTKLLADPAVSSFTIRAGQDIAGSVAKFEIEGKAEVTYWIDRKFWGQGVATAALTMLLDREEARPLYARVAFDNVGSQRVLENCGFEKIGTDRGFASARQAEIEEWIYRLD